MKTQYNSFYKSKKLISDQFGVLNHISKLPRLNFDPKLISYGIWPCNTSALNGEKFEGRSSGCHFNMLQAFMGTVGETVERYCPVFYRKEDMQNCCFKELEVNAVHPFEYALFHDKQYSKGRFPLKKFDENTKLLWDKCIDITNGKETWAPSACIYLPWTIEDKWITVGTSTGLAAHTNWHKALLTALYEIIERDSFSLTWWQKIKAPKLIIDNNIKEFILNNYPANYEWHFFDITYDLEIPTIYGICFGESEYGKFVAVGTATRETYSDALKKVILEIGQAVAYFRYLLGEKKDWIPSDNYNELLNFEDHSVFYIKRPDLWDIFKIWTDLPETKKIDFNETSNSSPLTVINKITSVLKNKGYNVLVKDLTTPDVNQAGLYCLRVIVPQLLQLGGAFPFYFLGGERMFSVPKQLGYETNNFENLNRYPHPFP